MNNQRGFTLIELLVTMTIMLLLISFVGPLTVDRIDKTKKNTEIELLRTKMYSFATTTSMIRCGAVINFKNHEMVYVNRCRSRPYTVSMEFEFLSFQDVTLHINRFGIYNEDEFSIEIDGRAVHIDLNALNNISTI